MTFIIPLVWLVMMFAARFLAPLPVILIVSTTMAAIVAFKDRSRMRELLRLTPRIAMLSVVAAFVMVGATYMIYPLLLPFVKTAAAALYTSFLSAPLPLAIAAVIPVIVSEEVLWRGRFQGRAGRWRLIVTPLIYAAAHAPLGSPLLVIVAFVCGLYWSALREMSGSLVPSLCAHLAWDVAIIVFPLVR